MLRVEGLTVYYGKAIALRNVSLEVKRGEIVVVIGSNGAGKTTLLNAIMNVIVKEGKVMFENIDISSLPIHKIAQLGISYLPDKRTIFGELSVFDNLKVAAYNHIKEKGIIYFHQKLDGIFEHFTNLREKLSLKAGLLSGGEQQMLSIAQSLIRSPKMVILDEPSAGLSPKLVKSLFDIVFFMRKNGLTVLMVEQNVNKTIRIADRVYIIKNGTIIDKGRAEEFYDNLRIKRAYFGG